MDAARKKNGTKGPAQIPKTDPDSRILPNKEGGYAANYTPMAITETGIGMIVDASVVIGNVEHSELLGSVETIVAECGVNIKQVLADSAYTRGENLDAMEKKGIDLIGPLAETKCKDNPAVRDDLTESVADDRIADLPAAIQQTVVRPRGTPY